MAPARVLVVDDSSTIRRVVSQALREARYEVSTAESGETALREAHATIPDLIILDAVMPGMTGLDFARRLQKDMRPGARSVPILLMATKTDPLQEGNLEHLGIVDSITKPFSPEAMLAVVAHSLEKHGIDAPREITNVTRLAEAQRNENGAQSAASTEQERDRAGEVLHSLARFLADALHARGVSDADRVAAAICAELRSGLPSSALAEAARRPSASLSGDLGAVPLPEILQLLKLQGQTGVLEVSLESAQPGSPPARCEVAVKDGLVVAVRGRDVRTDLLLGHYFVGSGLVSRTQLDAVLLKPAPSPLGQRLVEAGLITTEQLRRCVGAQAQDLMVELLRAREGFFSLRCGVEHVPQAHIRPGYSVDMLLFEALRRIDEWRVFETQVPSFDAHFLLESDELQDLTPDEIDVLSFFKRGSALSVRDVLHLSSLRAFDLCKLMYRLTLLKRLRRVDQGAAEVIDEADVGKPLPGAGS